MDIHLKEKGYIIKPADEKGTHSHVDTGHRGRMGVSNKAAIIFIFDVMSHTVDGGMHSKASSDPTVTQRRRRNKRRRRRRQNRRRRKG